MDARGLPRENYRKVRHGYTKLAEDGCVVIIGPFISDNSVNVRDLVNSTGVPCLGWTGPPVPRRVLLHRRQRRHPHRELDGRRLVLQERLRQGRLLLGAGLLGRPVRGLLPRRGPPLRPGRRQGDQARPEPEELPAAPGGHARAGRRGARLHGLRLLDLPLRGRLQGARLGPAAVHGHRVHVLLQLQRLGRGPRGLARGRPARRGRRQPELRGDAPAVRGAVRAVLSRNVVVALSYDTARAAIAGIGNARIATPEEVKAGLEQIKWMPCANGGPGLLPDLRRVRPPGLQGRLPHHPRAARRRAPFPRLLPAAAPVEHPLPPA